MVVLPAPFGPISPTIFCRPTLSDMPSTADTPKNRFVSRLASMIGGDGAGPGGIALAVIMKIGS